MKDELITVFEACRICEWRSTQAVYHRVKGDPTFPQPYPKKVAKGPMMFSRREIELWWAEQLHAKMENGGGMFVPYPGDDYYIKLLEDHAPA